MHFTDTHCHIHDSQYGYDAEEVLEEARQAGVHRMLCVGTSAENSKQAVSFAATHDGCYATLAQHPHEANDFGESEKATIASLVDDTNVVAIGECGLDYYYNHSNREAQEAALRWHLALAQEHDLPMVFHIRNAFSEFWPIFDEYPRVRGLVHSFTAGPAELDQALSRGLYVAFNGIMTFTKDKQQLEAMRQAPLERMVLETDAPFLTPKPNRGKINMPKYVVDVAKFVSDVKEVPLGKLSKTTEKNVSNIFGI